MPGCYIRHNLLKHRNTLCSSKSVHFGKAGKEREEREGGSTS